MLILPEAAMASAAMNLEAENEDVNGWSLRVSPDVADEKITFINRAFFPIGPEVSSTSIHDLPPPDTVWEAMVITSVVAQPTGTVSVRVMVFVTVLQLEIRA